MTHSVQLDVLTSLSQQAGVTIRYLLYQSLNTAYRDPLHVVPVFKLLWFELPDVHVRLVQMNAESPKAVDFVTQKQICVNVLEVTVALIVRGP